MLSVQTNILAANASRQLGITTKDNAKRTEKLSSGYRINRAADDAAGLSISEKMRRQMRGLTQAAANAQDGISMLQVGEGALNEVHDMLHRANELAVKAANGTLQDFDRGQIDKEIQQLKAEIDRTARNTSFNEISIFPENGYSPLATGYMEMKSYDISIDLRDGSFMINEAQAGTGAAGMGRAGVNAVSSGSVLADTIANEIVPNAVNQILDAFPALKTAVGSDTIDMALQVAYIDGKNNTMAYAYFTYKNSGGKPVSMGIRVDSADFKDADALGTGSNADALKSTMAHELMHSVLQYTLTDGMSGRRGEKYPTWFVEGTAQLAGGGFANGWNDTLSYYANYLTDEDDTSQDTNISNYLKKFTMGGRPYGHGYLGVAYLGYLAGGGKPGGTVDDTIIKNGMNRIFADLLGGKTLSSAIKDNTGITTDQLNSYFKNGNAGLTEFVRKLAFASKKGAGSVIAPGGLGDGPSSVLGTGALDQPFRIDPFQITIDDSGPAMIALQVGAEAGIHIDFALYKMNCKALGLEDLNVKTTDDADLAMEGIKRAIQYVSNVRSQYGAIQNRLEHTIKNLENITENTTAAESRIRDTDIAEEMVGYSNSQILMQAGTSMLTQANQSSQLILSLLG
ncbi:MAG: flagellinolysin [Lachnospiraceae bacterium]|nr:flagellinolysin [Lachnospiraceae bacterium]